MATASTEQVSYPIPRQKQAQRLRTARGIPLSVRSAKRFVDLAFSVSGLLAFGWIFPLIGLFIRLESPGPIFYRQRRVRELQGRDAHGRCSFAEFDMLKFRTMRVDAEAGTGAVLAEENDPRITRVGRILRKTRLDELPQLWHVLAGDMSLVGPRPERPELMENLCLAIPFFEERMRECTPGITGYAQVSLGYSGQALEGSAIADFEKQLTNPLELELCEGCLADDMRMKLLFDLAYVSALESFWTWLPLELGIIVKTPWVMLRGLGR